MAGFTPPRLPGLVEHHQKVAQALVDAVEDGTAAWVQAWKPGESILARNLKTGNAYKGSHLPLLAARASKFGFADARWGTRKQIKELGGRVRQGEKGYRICSWQFESTRPALDRDGKPVIGEDGQPVMETVRLAKPRVRSRTVYNADQADGLPKDPAKDPRGPDWDPIEAAESVLRESGATIRHRSDENPSYNLLNDRITLPFRHQYPTAAAYYQSALHELGHWTGHPSRLGRPMLAKGLREGLLSMSYAREELRAEISSMIAGDALGIGYDPKRSENYVGQWITRLREDPIEIHRACRDAQEMSDYLLNRAVLLERTKRLQATKPRPAGWRQAPPPRRPGLLLVPRQRPQNRPRSFTIGR